ncbi:MAG: hypothetical protein MJZ11_11400 [Lachnospiraceae bacterium]|nr:hypothetical protein [Lachnospiraceae bacterium]
MKELRIKYDFSHGPIWKDKYDVEKGIWSTGIDIIDNDKVLMDLNEKAENEYSMLYHFDKDGVLNFDTQAFISKQDALLSLIQSIVLRVESLNDGSFVVVDEESKRLSGNKEQL